MILSSDKEYKETKEIMLGKKSIRPVFKSLAEWIDQKFHVKTINIYYDLVDGRSPRLGIYFESEKEANSFHVKGAFTNYNPKKQKQIADRFIQILVNRPESEEFCTENILIYTSAFAPIARDEANGNIPQNKIEDLQRKFRIDELWLISRMFSGAVFFFYTDEQVKKYKNSKTVNEWTDAYFDLLTQYDVFGYFKRDEYSIHLDSKENLDNNYQGNLYYYYK